MRRVVTVCLGALATTAGLAIAAAPAQAAVPFPLPVYSLDPSTGSGSVELPGSTSLPAIQLGGTLGAASWSVDFNARHRRVVWNNFKLDPGSG